MFEISMEFEIDEFDMQMRNLWNMEQQNHWLCDYKSDKSAVLQLDHPYCSDS